MRLLPSPRERVVLQLRKYIESDVSEYESQACDLHTVLPPSSGLACFICFIFIKILMMV